MKVHEIAGLEAGAQPYYLVKALQNRSFPETNYDDIVKEINIDKHDVMNPSLRPDKYVYKKSKKAPQSIYNPPSVNANPDQENLELVRIEKINRITLSFQELICNKRVMFCLANPVLRVYAGITDEEVLMLKTAIDAILFDNKTDTQDREVARNIFTYCEVAEYWYPEKLKKPSKRYGFEHGHRLKNQVFSRENGEKFYPLKDEHDNLICFSREYQVKVLGKLVTFFQAFTDEEIIKFKRLGMYKWEIVEENPLKNEDKIGITKMPIVFGWQRHPEFRPAVTQIKRLETLLSNHAQINDYHASPKLFFKNAENIEGSGDKTSSSMILQGKGDADAKYLNWDDASVSIKLEIDNLLMEIYQLTQTPNISFDNIKGIGPVSGVAIKLLFMDAHLAVKDKEGVLLNYFQRRLSIIMEYLIQMNNKFEEIVEKVLIASKLDPFMVADDKEKAEILQIETGNQPVKSQETAVVESGGNKDELLRIQKETTARKLVDVTDPAF